jgi:uncharacterized protein YndB with AHSA1/START domain
MTARSIQHATFEIERELAATPARVYAAWSHPESKRAWFACHDDWPSVEYALDFRVGGRERNVVAAPGEPQHVFDAVYLDIVPEQRLIYAYEMRLGERRISASLATVLFTPCKRGTLLRFVEQAAFLDGYEGMPDRQLGTEIGLDNLERWLALP